MTSEHWEEWPEWTDEMAQDYMKSPEFLIDQLFNSSIDNICRLVDMAKEPDLIRPLRDRINFCLMLEQRCLELRRMLSEPARS